MAVGRLRRMPSHDEGSTTMGRHKSEEFQRDPLWYKDAIIYQTHVKAFYDSNDDGVGDFKGLTETLDYIQDLGVNTIWLLPFYPSPMRDDGYDIADYRNIAGEYGSKSDFKHFVREAHRRGLKVITELVINHTSDQHPWFQAARRAPRGSAKRNFYVWSDDDKKFPETRIIFTDTERSNWAWDEEAQQYYWHRFFSHQPDLNHNNPDVVKAVIRVMRYWLDMGVDGMRLDAIPYLCVREGTDNENLPETHQVLKQMRAVIDEHYQGRLFLAEANQWPEDVREYFGEGDECHMAYHFPLMPRMYMAIAQEDRHPIVEIMQQTPDIPENCQWAIFLRNHDELTLEMVTDRERDYMYNMYAVEPRMRINVGIRRRLAPLMDNNRSKIELLTSLLLSMPGSPILYYGDEIGMGDNIFLGDRNGVRTPMQWTPDRNAGFSRADPQRLYLPAIMDPLYGYQTVNVEAQTRSPSSLLHWIKRMIAVRKAYRCFGRGTLEFLRPGNRKILAYLRTYDEETVLCVANLSHTPQPVELDLARFNGRVPVELLSHTAFPPVGELPYLLTLQPYGFYGFRLATDVDMPVWHEEHLPPRELPTLVLLEGWQTFGGLKGDATAVRRLLATRTREQLQREVLIPYIEDKRWYAAKGKPIERVELRTQGEWPTPYGSWLLTLIDVKPRDEEAQTYVLPLGIAWEQEGETRMSELASSAVARVRQRAREGLLYSALGNGDFGRALLTAIGGNSTLAFGEGRLRFFTTSAFERLAENALTQPVSHPSLEQSNTSIFFGNRLFLKVYRRLQTGVNPELEMGRFLTETQPFDHVAPVAGGIVYQRDDGSVTTVALLQGYVENQGDSWHYTLDHLDRFLSGLSTEAATEGADPHAAYLILVETLGLRIGGLHKALSAASGDPLFDPEPAAPEDLAQWSERVRQEIDATLAALRNRRGQLEEEVAEKADRVRDRREELLARVEAAAAVQVDIAKTRYHGDLHLGQVLLVENDFVITDFEGEPGRPMAERRAKGPVLRDVAGMLRSFNYAGHAALNHATVERPDDRVRLAPLLQVWERATAAAFLSGYRSGVAGAPSYPEEPAAAQRLTELFVIEKALYEIRYELDNRPAWVEVPLAGLLQLLDGAT
jgi:maltose alpha-D-glucosyltransferase / alpha-amylase